MANRPCRMHGARRQGARDMSSSSTVGIRLGDHAASCSAASFRVVSAEQGASQIDAIEAQMHGGFGAGKRTGRRGSRHRAASLDQIKVDLNVAIQRCVRVQGIIIRPSCEEGLTNSAIGEETEHGGHLSYSAGEDRRLAQQSAVIDTPTEDLFRREVFEPYLTRLHTTMWSSIAAS